MIISVELGDFCRPPVKIRARTDGGVNHLILPMAWKPRFAAFWDSWKKRAEIFGAVSGVRCGPAEIKIAGFQTVCMDVFFAENQTAALLGRTVLAASWAKIENGRLVEDKLGFAREMKMLELKTALRRAGI